MPETPRDNGPETAVWPKGDAPIAVLLISLNEGHNLEAALSNLSGWAQEVFLVDSFSKDDTIDIALRHGIHVVQRPFRGFGDQWNFALEKLPITAPWTMKLDPDERLDGVLKSSIARAIEEHRGDALSIERQLWFMERPLPIKQRLTRVWRTGSCRFSDVLVNEHPIVSGKTIDVEGTLQHRDSPDLQHWLDKQNSYTTMEAITAYEDRPLAARVSLFGSTLERRMWFKRNFSRIPFRFALLFFYNWLIKGTWRAGRVGYRWARLRSDVMRLREYKRFEFEMLGGVPPKRPSGPGEPDPRVEQC